MILTIEDLTAKTRRGLLGSMQHYMMPAASIVLKYLVAKHHCQEETMQKKIMQTMALLKIFANRFFIALLFF